MGKYALVLRLWTVTFWPWNVIARRECLAKSRYSESSVTGQQSEASLVRINYKEAGNLLTFKFCKFWERGKLWEQYFLHFKIGTSS